MEANKTKTGVNICPSIGELEYGKHLFDDGPLPGSQALLQNGEQANIDWCKTIRLRMTDCSVQIN